VHKLQGHVFVAACTVTHAAGCRVTTRVRLEHAKTCKNRLWCQATTLPISQPSLSDAGERWVLGGRREVGGGRAPRTAELTTIHYSRPSSRTPQARRAATAGLSCALQRATTYTLGPTTYTQPTRNSILTTQQQFSKSSALSYSLYEVAAYLFLRCPVRDTRNCHSVTQRLSSLQPTRQT
jgi:hypothetical protein